MRPKGYICLLTLAFPALDLSSEHIKYRKLRVGSRRRSTELKVRKRKFDRCINHTFSEKLLPWSSTEHIFQAKEALILRCRASIGHSSDYIAFLLRVSHGRRRRRISRFHSEIYQELIFTSTLTLSIAREMELKEILNLSIFPYLELDIS